MKHEEYARMFELEDRYWWFRGRRRLVRTLLSQYRVWRESDRILDVGCGTGATLAELGRYGRATGLDRSLPALGFCRLRGFRSLVRGEAGRIPFQDGAFAAAVVLDLLEHVEDDARALAEVRRVVRPGGLVVLTVPAFPFLWSAHDVALRHLRRYRAAQIRALMEGAGFEVVKLSYAMSLLFVPIAVYRIVERVLPPRGEPQTTLKSVPRAVNLLLYGLLCLEARWIRIASFPFGVSIVGVGRRVEGES